MVAKIGEEVEVRLVGGGVAICGGVAKTGPATLIAGLGVFCRRRKLQNP